MYPTTAAIHSIARNPAVMTNESESQGVFRYVRIMIFNFRSISKGLLFGWNLRRSSDSPG